MSRARPTRPNLLVICSDQHHARLGGFRGHPQVKTPALDRLARQATVFTRAYCNTPICGPSRISFMTGRQLHEIGLWCNGVPWDGHATTWAARLGEAGYQTVSRGKMDVPGPFGNVGFADFEEPLPRAAYQPWPLAACRPYDEPGFHFDSFMDLPRAGLSREASLRQAGRDPARFSTDLEADLYLTGHTDHDRLVTDRVLTFLRESSRRQPWCLHVGLLNPHWPYLCPETFLQHYRPESIPLPQDCRFENPDLHPALQHYQATHNHYAAIRDEAHLRRILAAYCGLITCMDSMVGEILDSLEREGLAESTVVVYTSDHGEAAGEHGLFDKLTPYESASAVPLIIRGAGLPQARQCDRVVSLVDLYPTLLDLAGLLPAAGAPDRPGQSWLPLLHGEAQDRSAPVLIEYHGIFFRHSWFALVSDDWKFVWYDRERPSLFHLRTDPLERNDLGTAPATAAVRERFAAELRQRLDPHAVAARARRELAKGD